SATGAALQSPGGVGSHHVRHTWLLSAKGAISRVAWGAAQRVIFSRSIADSATRSSDSPGSHGSEWRFQRWRSLGVEVLGLCPRLRYEIRVFGAKFGTAKQVGSKAEQKRLISVSVSQCFLVRCAKELIAQPEPAAQLRRRLCYRTRPMLPREGCVEFGKARILSQRQQRYSRTF